MNINSFINEMSWKKLAVITFGFLAVSWLIHEILFWTFYHEAQQTFNQINSQISQQQKEIQQKLADSDREFNARNKNFDAVSDDLQKTVEETQQHISNYIDRMVQKDEELQEVFNKEFKEAPARMWAEHEKFGEEMRKDFLKQSQALQDKFAASQKKENSMKRYLKMIACFTLLYATTCHVNASNIIIFASFSMPKESIKQWIRQGTEIQAPIVIRGLVNNSFKDTINVLYNLNQEVHGGVQLDPTLFQKYQINKVPAVVITNTANCLPNQSCHETYDVVYGDVTLSYALKKIAAKNDDVASIANAALTILKEDHDL